MMDRFKIILAVGCLLALLAPGEAAGGVHDRGVASCGGCHTMHNSQDGMLVNPDNPFGSEMLLLYDSSTDLCLSCHATEYGAVLGSNPLDPPPEKGGGNFTFLLEDNINDGSGGLQFPIGGHQAGHNVVSPSWNIPVDPDNDYGPGGNFPANQLTCISCHDQHGNDNFRMLRGQGPTGGGGYTFIYPAPLGEGIDIVSEEESPTNHTAYRQGWARWCADCHGFYHDEHHGHHGGFEHAVDRPIGGRWRDSYNRYTGPSDPVGGDPATAYIPEVPFEDSDMTTSRTAGPQASSRIMCMTCHRAHATSAPKSTRWDPNVEFLGLDGLESGSYPIPNPYVDPEQRALCVKCHNRDTVNHGWGSPCMECPRQGAK